MILLTLTSQIFRPACSVLIGSGSGFSIAFVIDQKQKFIFKRGYGAMKLRFFCKKTDLQTVKSRIKGFSEWTCSNAIVVLLCSRSAKLPVV
jgi:hypothetical protein